MFLIYGNLNIVTFDFNLVRNIIHSYKYKNLEFSKHSDNFLKSLKTEPEGC